VPRDSVASTTNLAPLAQPDARETTEQTKEQKIEQLNELATNDDNESLSTILQELDNPDKEIRSAALEAAIQFGETTNTISRLKDLVNRTSDPAEQKTLLEAIEFIALPPISELKPNPNPPKPTDQAPVPVPVPRVPPPTGS
jgi:HEAT repeat protein